MGSGPVAPAGVRSQARTSVPPDPAKVTSCTSRSARSVSTGASRTSRS
ncbi:hypothetical protein BC477_08475 [Clavibacter michiganensis subsp. michiganensis]|uniref:Uncharacterized protein n=1 Tax=Clavibacter michiganensis subsp. michiganensis TaxID=33013 RepID=A0A251XNY5_CLAMM|nr:hypothetical protein BC477_08475 [Clavibacter michiganensis subsp. michiganensis]OUE04758.1 hypothetical protein CMMCAS07_07405 [Clavibacter michiganensis subsp. michiganensis]